MESGSQKYRVGACAYLFAAGPWPVQLSELCAEPLVAPLERPGLEGDWPCCHTHNYAAGDGTKSNVLQLCTGDHLQLSRHMPVRRR